MTINIDQFRASMRHLAGHVCIVTTADKDGQRNGLTATAVCSVSGEPPTILCCVNKQNGSYETIKSNGHFAINVLSEQDQALSNRFAGKVRGDARFLEGDWITLTTGSPILSTALAGFDCEISEVVDAHSHALFMGAIKAVHAQEDSPNPLLYAHGAYGTFTPERKDTHQLDDGYDWLKNIQSW